MLVVFVVSLGLRILALGWSLALLRRLRDWHVVTLCLLMLMLVTAQSASVYTHDSLQAVLQPWEAVPSIIVSVMAVVMVGVLDHMLDQRHAADRQLKANEHRYRSLVELSPHAIILQRGSRITYANPAAARLWGATDPQQLIGRPVLDLIHPDFRNAVRDRIQSMLATGQQVPVMEQRLIRLDSSVAYAEVTAAPFVDASGPAIQVLLRDTTAHRSATEALRETMARLDITVASANIGLWTHDVQSGNVYYSPAWKSQLGYRDEEIANNVEEWRSRLHPEDRDRVLSYLENFIREGSQDYITEFRLRHRDGSYRWIYARGSFYPEADGSRRRLMGCHVDLTERKAVEESLREANERLRLAMAAARMGSWEWNSLTRTAHISAEAAEILGLGGGAAEHPLEYYYQIIHPEDRAGLDAAFARAEQSGEFTAEYRVVWRDGSVHSLLSIGRVYLGSASIPMRIVGVTLDMTSRKQAELELRQSEVRFQSMAQVTPVGLFRTDPRGACTYVNERWSQITGLTPEQACGQGWAAAIHPDDAPLVMSRWLGAVAAGQPLSIEFRYRRPDGTVTWVIGQSAVETMPDGTVIGYVGSITDINDRKREERRRRLMMNELDHRVKNNLASVLSLAQQTLSSCKDLEEFRSSFTGRIHAMAQSHALLARRRWEGLDLTEAARLILGPFLQHPQQHNRIEIDGPPLMLPARAALPVSLAIHELATNAIKHGALSVPGGSVSLQWLTDGRDTLLRWTERGGPPVASPSTRGMGTQLIHGLIAYELHGKVQLEFQPAGLLATIRIPGDIAADDKHDLALAEAWNDEPA